MSIARRIYFKEQQILKALVSCIQRYCCCGSHAAMEWNTTCLTRQLVVQHTS